MKARTLLWIVVAAGGLRAQVTWERLLNAAKEPQNWLTYSGTYSSQRYSTLTQITPANVTDLEMKWVWQADSIQKNEATPLVVDGVMYTTQAPNDVVALDAKTGRIYWVFQYKVSPDVRLCCGQVNRGLAILGNTLFLGTVDAHLLALDAKNGRVLWNTEVADPKLGYSITEAPLVIKDKVVLGPAGGEYGIRGFFAAYNASDGKLAWKFHTVPAGGEPGSETWAGDSWKHGSAASWITGSYDPDLNLIYYGTGNPGPDWNPDERKGDNLYSCSLVALDADTGNLKWHFQFTPNDSSDWDSTQVPVLSEMDWNGARRKVLMLANRNGFFYVLDRTNGQFLRGNAFVHQTWAAGLDEKGRPVRLPDTQPTVEGTRLYPGMQGGTNWYSPSFSPRTGFFYLSAWKDYYSYFSKLPVQYNEGQNFYGGATKSAVQPIRRGPINVWTDAAGHGEVIALDPHTGQEKWSFKTNDVSDSGILTTASDLLFTGGREGYFWALDARSGQPLWHATTGGQISSTAITYMIDGRQYVAISANHALFVFGLRDR
jgi:alcohol dehydrogenase (cytochrome c)